MSYATFLAIFLGVPLAGLAALLRGRLLERRFLVVVGALVPVALVYMAPWDHLAAVWGLWTWTAGQTWGTRIWAIPPEEYLFCVLEALLAAGLTYALLLRRLRVPGASGPGAARKPTEMEGGQ